MFLPRLTVCALSLAGALALADDAAIRPLVEHVHAHRDGEAGFSPHPQRGGQHLAHVDQAALIPERLGQRLGLGRQMAGPVVGLSPLDAATATVLASEPP